MQLIAPSWTHRRSFAPDLRVLSLICFLACLFASSAGADVESTKDVRFQSDAAGTLVAVSGTSHLDLDAGVRAGETFDVAFRVPVKAAVLGLEFTSGTGSTERPIHVEATESHEVARRVQTVFASAGANFRWVGYRCTLRGSIPPGHAGMDWQVSFLSYPDRVSLASHEFKIFWIRRVFGADPTLESWNIYRPEERFGAGQIGPIKTWTLALLAPLGLLLFVWSRSRRTGAARTDRLDPLAQA